MFVSTIFNNMKLSNYSVRICQWNLLLEPEAESPLPSHPTPGPRSRAPLRRDSCIGDILQGDQLEAGHGAVEVMRF